MSSFKPMLAGKAPPPSDINFPALTSVKLDGIRCVITDQGVFSRTLKPIQNKKVFEYLNRPELVGLDGELIFGSPTDPNAMQATSSAVMSHDGPLEGVTFYVFDDFTNPGLGFLARYNSLFVRRLPEQVKILPHAQVRDVLDLIAEEDRAVRDGYEGLMIRAMNGVYKFGRSTTREGGLLKLKRFDTDEATIIGFEELMHNENEATRDELGRTKRSASKEGKVPGGVLGAFVCRSPKWPSTFTVGGGLTAEQRADFWKRRKELFGQFVTFAHQPHGAVDAPRLPTFKALRHADDMGEAA